MDPPPPCIEEVHTYLMKGPFISFCQQYVWLTVWVIHYIVFQEVHQNHEISYDSGEGLFIVQPFLTLYMFFQKNSDTNDIGQAMYLMDVMLASKGLIDYTFIQKYNQYHATIEGSQIYACVSLYTYFIIAFA